ncbi:hypothetical protein EJ02DRAFT_469590 [Clathrospora elynae]|uniref:Uncharacterized protein n=1 Tax=Clathrospora elynae TaxID=706981 RepID=A0A6A5SJM3_9PLEO|nr:hypothetical protein EJ02DRAFT_469590 [Clathrospora elynae]
MPSSVELTIPIHNEPIVQSQYEVLPTPATPKSGEDFARLLAMIKHVPNDEASSQHKERLQQKVSHAAQTFLAKNPLLRDHNRFLTKINDESKPRRATKSTILGKARVMTWEDLEKKRVEHAEKEAKKAAKAAREAITGKKRGRPRKITTADTPEPKAKVARTSETQIERVKAGPSEPRAKVVQRSIAQAVKASPLKPKSKVVQRSEAQVAEGEAGPSNASFMRREAQLTEGEAGPSNPKANTMRSEVQVAEGKAGPSRLNDVAHSTPQVKKVKIVPKPWGAPEARMV